jgi:diguanylate cyclase (GGDEF)-like protein
MELLCGFLVGLIAYLCCLKKQVTEIKKQLKQSLIREQQRSKELAEYKNKFHQEVLHDTVTGLPSLPIFKEQVQRAIEQNHSCQGVFGLAFIDLRNFKVINNTLGYAAGDAVLKEVAARLQKSIRQIDAVCRFSGDVFIILMSKLTYPEAASIVVQRCFRKLTEPFQVEAHALSLPVCVGLALYPADGADADTLLKNAAHALSRAKIRGVQECEAYHVDLDKQSHRELLLNSALSREEFFDELIIEYQPQINIEDHSVFCWEVLLRWQHPELGIVPANAFIQLAENSGKIVAMGEWVLQQVCQQWQQWRLQGHVLPWVAINVSLRQLENPHFVSQVLHVLQETQFDPHGLIFEITEKDLVKNTPAIEKVFSILSRLGVRITVDHFSTGESLLQNIQNLSIYGFKISSQVVHDLTVRQECATLVAMMVSMAKNKNRQIVAVGVETESQRQLLANLGCTHMQGYLFSPPLSAPQVLKKLPLQQAKSVQEENLTVS